jgi:hypothetical protein
MTPGDVDERVVVERSEWVRDMLLVQMAPDLDAS